MKAILISVLCLHSALTTAQDTSEFRSIKSNFQTGSIHNEQAIRVLSATNELETNSRTDYQAGRAVVLLPGFEAKSGSVFVAHVGEVSIVATIEGQVDPLMISAYPNPFEESTTVSYTLSRPARVTLFVSDARGVVVSRLVDNQQQEAGRHDIEWKGDALVAGVYVYTLDADQQRISNRLVRK